MSKKPPILPPDGYRSDYDPVGRMYGLGSSMNRLADLLDTEDNPLATLMRVIGEDIEDCAAWVEEYLEDDTGPYVPPADVCDRVAADLLGDDAEAGTSGGWELP